MLAFFYLNYIGTFKVVSNHNSYVIEDLIKSDHCAGLNYHIKFFYLIVPMDWNLECILQVQNLSDIRLVCNQMLSKGIESFNCNDRPKFILFLWYCFPSSYSYIWILWVSMNCRCLSSCHLEPSRNYILGLRFHKAHNKTICCMIWLSKLKLDAISKRCSLILH